MEDYQPNYTNSWALCIGINKYKHSPILEYAVNDAEAISKILVEQYSFPKENVITILDNKATRSNIMSNYLSFSKDQIKKDDKIVFFFAGHGYTHQGRRGETGYLIPFDGKPDDLSTLIRWNELTQDSDLIPAKHMLFIMDACYGGLAFQRGPTPGSVRFIKNMLTRYARQVLTAGKSDEVVADSGGPVPNHSIFTGHLINALEGEASDSNDTISAYNVMAYVYDKVGKDRQSNQTPHYGFLDGEGDLIFKAPILDTLGQDDKIAKDAFIEIPSGIQLTEQGESKDNLGLIKEYLADERYRIKLDEQITKATKAVLSDLSLENFPVGGDHSNQSQIVDRLSKYEEIVSELNSVLILLSHWGSQNNNYLIQKTLSRISDSIERTSGTVILLELMWYPMLLLFYYSGISAISANNYVNLALILNSERNDADSYGTTEKIITPLCHSYAELFRYEVFKQIQNHESYFTPISEYLFKLLQSDLDELLFIGKSYESLFDKFEILFSLTHAHIFEKKHGRIRGPFGRFAWKYREYGERSSFTSVLNEAKNLGSNWAPLKAGLFDSSLERFLEISSNFEELMKKLNWH